MLWSLTTLIRPQYINIMSKCKINQFESVGVTKWHNTDTKLWSDNESIPDYILAKENRNAVNHDEAFKYHTNLL